MGRTPRRLSGRSRLQRTHGRAALPTIERARGEDRLAAALERLRDTDVDVVLLDLGLPDSEGLATLRRLRTAAPTVPVVVLTGSADDDVARRAVLEGAQDVIDKDRLPLIPVGRLLHYAVDHHRLRQELSEREQRLRALVALTDDDAAHALDDLGPRTEESRPRVTYRREQQDGTWVWFEDRRAPVPAPDGRITVETTSRRLPTLAHVQRFLGPGRTTGTERDGGPPSAPDDRMLPPADVVVARALRGLVHADSVAQLRAAITGAVTGLGGTVRETELDAPDALPLDVSVRVGPPAVAAAALDDPVRLVLQRELPPLVEDARTAAARLRRAAAVPVPSPAIAVADRRS